MSIVMGLIPTLCDSHNIGSRKSYKEIILFSRDFMHFLHCSECKVTSKH